MKAEEIKIARLESGGHSPNTFNRHGGETSAISQMRRRLSFVWEIAGQARNDGKREKVCYYGFVTKYNR